MSFDVETQDWIQGVIDFATDTVADASGFTWDSHAREFEELEDLTAAVDDAAANLRDAARKLLRDHM